ncbi:hypothetical protein QIH52_26930, partial [Klebsiella pneumoniae]|nr:hypothetical protein [Klebsiella pneumoniae]
VGDGDAAASATFGENIDARRAGIDGILHQFLHRTRGPLNHLAGGDAVDDLNGELADGHGNSGAIR